MTTQWSGQVWVGGLILAILWSGCGEFTPPPANSEYGHLYVELEEALAEGTSAEVLVFGPVRSGQICHNGECYYDHRAIEILEVEISEPDVLRYQDAREERFLGVPGTWLSFEALSTGTARVELRFTVEDLKPAELVVDEEEQAEELPEYFEDAFDVEVRGVHEIRVKRILDRLDPTGPYGSCPAHGPGLYLTESPGAFDVVLGVETLDHTGARLRGRGSEPAFEIEAEGALEILEEVESLQAVRVRARQMGVIDVTPRVGERGVSLVYRTQEAIEQIEARAFRINDQGARLGLVNQFQALGLYEVEVLARDLEAPLCGGQMNYRVDSLTPAICESLGEIEGRRSAAFYTHAGGECLLRITVEGARGGAGISQELVIPVGYQF